MKRILSLLLTAILALSSLTGCGKSTVETSSGKTVLTVWAHKEESWNISYQKIIDDFMVENPDIKIKLELFPYDEYESKVQTSLLTEKGGADIYELWGGWGLDFAPTGALAEIPIDLSKEIEDDAYEPTFAALKYNDKLYGMPLEYNLESGGMLVNVNLLKENNLTLPTTWDELVEDAKKVAKTDGDVMTVKGFDFMSWDSVTYLFLSMILSQGGQYLKEDGTVDFNTPEAKKAFEELYSLAMVDQVTDLEGLTNSNIDTYQQLFAGTTLFNPRGAWTIAEGESTFGLTYGIDFEYQLCPWYGDAPGFAAETGWSLAVNGKSKSQEAAFKFLSYFFRNDILLENNIACSTIPPKKSVAQSEDYLNEKVYMKDLVGNLDKGQFIGYFNTDRVKETINTEFLNYCNGVTPSAEEALSKIENTINNG